MVETCLANTGQNMYSILIMSGLVIACAIMWYLHGKRSFVGFSAFSIAAIVGLTGVVPTTAFAAEGCSQASSLMSVPDTSTGVKGATQIRNVLANDTPTPGSSFVLSSLRLGLVQGHVLGSSVSSDQKTVTAPTEGVYTAQNDGSIRYVPDINFVGTAEGVTYSINDTAGNTTSNTYRPVVTDTPPVSCNETYVLPDQFIFAQNSLTMTRKLNSYDIPLRQIESSANGDRLVALSSTDVSILQSLDGGSTWLPLTTPNINPDWGEVAISADGQTIAATDYNNSTSIVSRDGGATWQTHALTMGGFGHMSLSSDGNVLYYVKAPSLSPTTLTLYRSVDDGATWSMTSQLSDRLYSDMAVSSDGQIISLLAVDGSFTASHYMRSTDGGLTFNDQTLATNAADRIASSNNGSIVMYMAAGSYLERSTDGGASWSQQTAAGIRPWREVLMSGDGQVAYGLADGQTPIMTSDGGSSWSSVAAVPASSLWNRSALSSDGVHVILNSIDVPRLSVSKDAGATWEFPVGTYGIDTMTIDLDTATPGRQTTRNGTYTDGFTTVQWTASYDAAQDVLTLTFDTNPVTVYGSFSFQYGATMIGGCPASPGSINFDSQSGGS